MSAITRCLSRYRNELKGFAILWVVFFHARLGLDSGLLYQIKRIGYGGVDIFFFLSGYGLYYSLKKDNDLTHYLKRRAMRILPAYLPFCLVWLAVMLPLSGKGLAACLRIAAGNLTMTGYFAGVDLNINWYLSALAMSMAVAPLFCAVLSEGRYFRLRVLELMAVLLTVGCAYIGNGQYMAISRLPVFALGMVFATPDVQRLSLKKTATAMAAAALLGGAALFVCLEKYAELLVTYAMYWHPFLLITPGLCCGLAWLFDRFPAAARKPFEVFGKASFEIFLFNVWLEALGKNYGLASTPSEWLGWSVAGIGVGLAYHWLVGKVSGRIQAKILKK